MHPDLSIKAFGLLHVEPAAKSAENLSNAIHFEAAISIYCSCALTLCRSLKSIGIDFALATNSPDVVRKFLGDLSGEIEVIEIPFEADFPHDLRFFSAHYIFDLMKFISGQTLDYGIILDLDMVATGTFPEAFAAAVDQRLPLVYEISRERAGDPAVMQKLVEQNKSDLSFFTDVPGDPIWYGGEFLAGPPEFFGEIVNCVGALLPKYSEVRSNLHHQGDETLTTVALTILSQKGIDYVDAGRAKIVRRFWSSIGPHEQKPLGKRADNMFLHLPGDKEFLASICNIDQPQIIALIDRYCLSMSPILPSFLRKFLRRPFRKAKREVIEKLVAR